MLRETKLLIGAAMGTALKTVALTAVLLSAACDDQPPLGPDTELVVTLLSPDDGVVVRQNDPSIGCAPHPYRGYGFRLALDWEDTDHPAGVQAYQIWVQHRGSDYPLVETATAGSEYSYQACNAFVIDRNLEDWEWQVRALAGDGQAGPWSEVRVFTFAPCRLEGGGPCNAPPDP